VPSVIKSSPTTTISCRITESQKEWEERGETIIQTIFKQHISGAMKKKDRPEWMTNGRPVVHRQSASGNLLCQLPSVPDVCLSRGATNAHDPFSEIASKQCNRIARSKRCPIGLCVDAGGRCSAFAEIACHNKSIPRGRSAWCLSAFGPWLRNLLEDFPQRMFYW
jgi:hypothetical protein